MIGEVDAEATDAGAVVGGSRVWRFRPPHEAIEVRVEARRALGRGRRGANATGEQGDKGNGDWSGENGGGARPTC